MNRKKSFLLPFSLSLLCFSLHAQSSDQIASIEGTALQFSKKNSWQEIDALYNFQKKNSHAPSALLGAVGFRSDTYNFKHHVSPSTINSLIAMTGYEWIYSDWIWQWTLEGAFQVPKMSLTKQGRYTFETYGSYQFTNTVSAQFGAGVRCGLSVPTSYPIIGVMYLSDPWDLELLFPNLAAAKYQIDKQNNLGLYLIHKVRVNRANRAFGHDDAILYLQTVFAEMRWKHDFSHKLSLWVSLGWNVYSRLQAGNHVFDHERQIFHSNRGALATLGIKKEF